MADKAEDLVYLKYFKGIISYEGLQRIENYPIPRQAFREAILNAIIHRDYSTGNPIHIHIYPDKVFVYNDGRLPENWTVKDLLAAHTSKPYNPLIAGAFFRSGQIEAWGRGVEKISEACKVWGKQEPFYKISPNEVMIGFNTDVSIAKSMVNKLGMTAEQAEILRLMRENPNITTKVMANMIGQTQRNIQLHIQTFKTMGIVERVGATKNGHWVVKMPERNGGWT